MITCDSVMTWPVSAISSAGSNPPGTLRRNSAGLSPYARIFTSEIRTGTRFSSTSSIVFWLHETDARRESFVKRVGLHERVKMRER